MSRYTLPADGCVERLAPRPGGTGELAGLRLAVKDNIEVAGAHFTAGHPLFADRLGRRTAPAVQAMMDAGAELVAMAATDAGGFGVTSPGVCNPRHPRRTIGGSSGGCAALVAAGRADLGLGTDTGGSIRIPAACAGLWGFKPEHGAIPLKGVWRMAPRFDTLGLMADSLGSLTRGIIALLPDLENVPAPESLRLGIFCGPGWARDRATSRLFSCVLKAAERMGVELIPLRFPPRSEIVKCHSIQVLLDSAKVYVSFGDDERSKLAPSAAKALRSADRITDEEAHAAARMAERVADLVSAADKKVHAVLTPTLSVLPPRLGSEKSGTREVLAALTGETCIANLMGRPAICGPVGWVGLQILGIGSAKDQLFSLGPHIFQRLHSYYS